MSRSIFVQFFQSILPGVSTEKAQQLTAVFEPMFMNKNSLLITENKPNTETYFMESGIIRSYVHNQEGHEVTTEIFVAPCFVNDFLAFFKQQPASETFQCLTECHIWKASFEQIQTVFHASPEFREFGRLMLVTNYAQLHQRTMGLIKDTAEQRYLRLMQRHPNVFQYVPLKFIASYLGVTDTSLSRIRKEIKHR